MGSNFRESLSQRTRDTKHRSPQPVFKRPLDRLSRSRGRPARSVSLSGGAPDTQPRPGLELRQAEGGQGGAVFLTSQIDLQFVPSRTKAIALRVTPSRRAASVFVSLDDRTSRT